MSTSYTGRDIVAIRQNLIDKINGLTNDWTDRNQSDLGMVFLEFVASVGDFLSFYMDKQALETYLDTAVQDKNVLSLLRVMNYRVPLLGGAKGEVTVNFENAVSGTHLVPRYTEFFCSKDNIYYSTTQDYYLYEGDTSKTFNVLQGTAHTVTTTKDDIINSGTGRRIYLNSTAVADGSVSISQDGVVWVEVEDALLEYKGGYFYSVHKDSSNSAYILLSPNYLDLLPKNADEEITIKYVETLGLSGTVASSKIDSLPTSTTSLGNYNMYNLNTITSISNASATYGAWDNPDLTETKILARKQAQSMGRYITVEDYENAVKAEPYVMSCKVFDWRTSPTLVTDPYITKVWAVDWGGNSLGSQDIATLTAKVNAKGVAGTTLKICPTTRIPVNINVRLYFKTTTTAIKDKVKALVESHIRLTYALENMDYGKKISLAYLTSLVMGVSEYIEDCVINSPTLDIVSSDVEFPYLNSVVVSY